MNVVMSNKILGVPDMAKELGISQTRVRQLINDEKIEGVEKVGREWAITREDFELFKSLERKPGRPKKRD